MSDNIIEINTEHAQPIKTLFEVLKEVLQDVIIEIKQDTVEPPKKKHQLDDESVEESEEEDSDDNSEEDDSGDDEEEGDGDDDDEEEEEEEEEEDDDDDDEDDDSDEEEGEKLKKTDSETKEDVSKKRGFMRIMAVDPTKTIFIHLKLEAKNFTKFKCKNSKYIIGVNLLCFYKLIKSMDKDDNLTLFMKKNDHQRLWIKRYNADKDRETLDDMQLIDLDPEKYKIPATVFEAVIKMQSSDFHKVCREMSNIADYVEIQCINNKLIFKCKGEFSGRKVTYVDNSNNEDDDSDCDDNKKSVIKIKHSNADKNKPLIVKEIYELKNITLFNKFTSLCEHIQIYMKSNYPLIIRYTVATLGHILVCFTPVKTDQETKFQENIAMYKDN